MYHPEACQHTRNYGCRLRQYQWESVEMLSLENKLLKVVFALGKGADIVELLYKPTDTDVMWHSFNQLKNINHISSVAASNGNFLDAYAGGWQELFPIYGAYADYCGAQIGVHGEACLYPWTYQILCDSPERVEVRLSLRTIRSPFLLEKTVRLDEGDAVLHLHQKVTNLGAVKQQFMWGHHPAFGFPFLDDSVRLHISGKPTVTVPPGTIAHHCPFDRETTGKWPMLPGKDGKLIDMSRAYRPEDKLYMEYALSDLDEGSYALVNHNTGLGVRLQWDKDIFPYLWVWGLYCGIDAYPWYGRAYVMAVEPWSTMPANYNDAKKHGGLLELESGASIETDVSAAAFIWQEG